jgi:hypothetical protein
VRHDDAVARLFARLGDQNPARARLLMDDGGEFAQQEFARGDRARQSLQD